MDWNQIENFESLNKIHNSNPYELSMILSKYNRDICIYYKKCIVGSEVFDWILTGTPPKKLKTYLKELLNNKSYSMEYLDEELNYIDDSDVCNDVRLSIKNSIKKQYLIYCYRKTKHNEFLKSRVRILSKIIWNGIKDLELENRIL